MAWFLFIDESGHDKGASPYEVLAGVAIQDRDIWNLVNALHDAEIRNFGRRYSLGPAELKGKKLLKKKVFEICARFRCKAFASIVEKDAHSTNAGGLRKDYGYLFERFFYFLEDAKPLGRDRIRRTRKITESHSH